MNITNLNTNIDNFREFLASLTGNVSVIALTESWCDDTANENFLLGLDGYFSVHQTIKNEYICIYIHKELEFKLRNDINIFNNGIKHALLKL